MSESDEPRGGDSSKVVCAWCGGVIRPAASRPSQGMCQPCFARMMREHSRAHRPRAVGHYASER